MSRPKLVVLVDFDGTAAAQNVAETLLERFGGESWREYRQAFRDGSMTLREYQERAFNDVEATLDAMGAALKDLCWPREGFPEFASFCQTNGIQVVIATNGLSFYVDSVLEHAGLEHLPACTVGVEGAPGQLRYTYRYDTPACWEWGNCKCRLVEEYAESGAVKTVMVGDGWSDYCAARHADAAFARATMRDHCDANGVPYLPFEDFHDVLKAFQTGIPGVWEPSGS